MDRNLALEAVRVTEAAALAAARYVGRGDEMIADQEAAKAIERAFRAIPVKGSIVIGEGGEEDGVALYEGEQLGCGGSQELHIAVDAIDGTIACATGAPNALSIIALSDDPEAGGFLRCPRTYMDKIAVGPEGREAVDLDRSPTDNLKALADARRVYVEDLTVVMLDRPRHDKLVSEVRKAGARIRLIPDGEVSAALATTRPESGIDLVMGVGGASQGVLAAAGLFCAGGMLQGRFLASNSDEASRLRQAGIHDAARKYQLADLVHGSIMFAATGVTNGDFLQGVRFFRGGAMTNSVVMRSKTRTQRLIQATHHFDFKPEY
ncbi:MAG: class II fructose-bisphosphatase [Candidatus Binatia bacterium]